MNDLTTLAEVFRTRGTEQNQAAKALLSNPEFATNPILQVACIVGQLNGTIYSALAEFAGVIPVPASAVSPAIARRQAFSKFSQQVRTAQAKAVSTGDWSEYDALIDKGFSFDLPQEPAPNA